MLRLKILEELSRSLGTKFYEFIISIHIPSMDSLNGHVSMVSPVRFLPSQFSIDLQMDYFRLYPLYFVENVNYWGRICNVLSRRIASNVYFHYERRDFDATLQDISHLGVLYNPYFRKVGALLVALLVLLYLVLLFWHDTEKEELVVVYKYGEKLPFPELDVPSKTTSSMSSPPPAPVKTLNGLANHDLSPKVTPLKSTNFASRQEELDYETLSLSPSSPMSNISTPMASTLYVSTPSSSIQNLQYNNKQSASASRPPLSASASSMYRSNNHAMGTRYSPDNRSDSSMGSANSRSLDNRTDRTSISRSSNVPYGSENNSTRYATAEAALAQSVVDPRVLIGFKADIEGYGVGIIIAIKRVKFHTTKYLVQFPDGNVHVLSLKRSDKKGKVPFRLLTRV